MLASQQRYAEISEEIHAISQLLRAYSLYELDVEYVVTPAPDSKVLIVDENTGRVMPGRRWSDGPHQAVEAKEGVAIERETRTYATITIQNYFRMYEKLAGMTGTAETEGDGVPTISTAWISVQVIPTNQPCIRLRPQRFDLQDPARQIHRGGARNRDGQQARSARPGRHHQRGVVRGPLAHAEADRRHPHRAQRQVPPAGGRKRVPRRIPMGGHDRHQHGRPRHRHQIGRGRPLQGGAPGGCGRQGRALPPDRGRDRRHQGDRGRERGGSGPAAQAGIERTGGSSSSARSGTSRGRIDRQLRGRCSWQGDPGLDQALPFRWRTTSCAFFSRATSPPA